MSDRDQNSQNSSASQTSSQQGSAYTPWSRDPQGKKPDFIGRLEPFERERDKVYGIPQKAPPYPPGLRVPQQVRAAEQMIRAEDNMERHAGRGYGNGKYSFRSGLVEADDRLGKWTTGC